jgi:hypothetical protein
VKFEVEGCGEVRFQEQGKIEKSMDGSGSWRGSAVVKEEEEENDGDVEEVRGLGISNFFIFSRSEPTRRIKSTLGIP